MKEILQDKVRKLIKDLISDFEQDVYLEGSGMKYDGILIDEDFYNRLFNEIIDLIKTI